jgi:hypothetical protein
LAHIYFTCDGVGDEVVYLFGFMVFEVGDRSAVQSCDLLKAAALALSEPLR